MSVNYKVKKGIKQTITEMSDEKLSAEVNKYKGMLWASAYYDLIYEEIKVRENERKVRK